MGLTFDAGGIENGVLKDPSAEGIACLFQQILIDGTYSVVVVLLWFGVWLLTLRFFSCAVVASGCFDDESCCVCVCEEQVGRYISGIWMSCVVKVVIVASSGIL